MAFLSPIRAALAVTLAGSASSLFAQTTQDNATRQADDAFGISVGTETIGLYNSSDVRNFSPEAAANIRIDGIYFDQQGAPTERVVGASIIRVGINTLGYAFPAPSGVVEYRLRPAPSRSGLTTTVGVEGFFSPTFKADGGITLIDGRLTIAGGASWQPSLGDYRGPRANVTTLGAIVRFTPDERKEFTAFYDRTDKAQVTYPLYISGGPYPIPQIERGLQFSPDWAKYAYISENMGLIASAKLTESLKLKAGIFNSRYDSSSDFIDLYTDVRPDGSARRLMLAYPDQLFTSISGEAQLEFTATVGRTRHIVTAVARGRDRRQRYGGEDILDFGADRIDQVRAIPEPQFDFGPQDRDAVRQLTGGLIYRFQLGRLVDLTAGIQKTDYRKQINVGGIKNEKSASPVLYNVLAAVKPVDALTVYASYSKGLEESGIAPSTAANRGELLPPIQTTQGEIGLKTTIGPMAVVATAFQLERPYTSIGADGIYGFTGSIRNRGIEMSLTGEPLEGLSAVVGAVLLDPEVRGEPVDLGLIGKRPITFAKFALQGALDYRLPFLPGGSIDVQIGSFSSRTARNDNKADIPPRTLFNLGARYAFDLGGRKSSLRFQILNVFNNYGAVVGAGEVQGFNIQRRARLLLTTDF